MINGKPDGSIQLHCYKKNAGSARCSIMLKRQWHQHNCRSRACSYSDLHRRRYFYCREDYVAQATPIYSCSGKDNVLILSRTVSKIDKVCLSGLVVAPEILDHKYSELTSCTNNNPPYSFVSKRPAIFLAGTPLNRLFLS
jgi:hypothetical protein